MAKAIILSADCPYKGDMIHFGEKLVAGNIVKR
jgi:hypothetical protein